jgi:flagellar biogenesis protein FliO
VSTTIKVLAVLAVIGAVLWYVMRAQRQAATINSASAPPVAPPTVPGAGA